MTKTDFYILSNNVLATPAHSTWERGCVQLAMKILINVSDNLSMIHSLDKLRLYSLGGANDWVEYSYSGRGLRNECEICKMLCSPSIAERKKCGVLKPNKAETWWDVQARALEQAWEYIRYKYMRLFPDGRC